MNTIQPTDICGYGRGSGEKGGLGNIHFESRCPPAIQPRTRILGLCCTDDYGDAASPSEDGWFLSDFYAFHHIYDNPSYFNPSSQIWLTCLDPEYLVNKYTEYAHGNPLRDRRVVLDAAVLPRIKETNNIRVVSAEILLERFLATLEEQTKLAVENDEPVLVLIFGHGMEGVYSVSVGGKSLTIRAFQNRAHTKAKITLLMTSCYSGGWLTKVTAESHHNHHRSSSCSSDRLPIPMLNISGITAAEPGMESVSWPLSGSIGRRACGSVVATAILKALIQVEEATAGGSGVPEDIQDSPTYVAMCKEVVDATASVNSQWKEDHGLTFAAKDDKWGMEWRARSGIPLNQYRQQWQKLRAIPPSTTADMSDISVLDTAVMTGPRRYGSSAEPRKFNTTTQAYDDYVYYKTTQHLAQIYLASFPGRDNVGSNTCFHPRLKNLIEGHYSFSNDHIRLVQNLNSTLNYRLLNKQLTTCLKDYLGLDFPDANAVDTRAIRAKLDSQQYNAIYSKIFNAPIIPRPVFPHQGYFNTDPVEYLATALASANLSAEQVEQAVEIMSDYVLSLEHIVAESLEPAIKEVRRRPSVKHCLDKISEKLGRRLKRERSKSVSPVKKAQR